MILTEGVFDCWRVGEDAVATFGTHITEEQKKLIHRKNLKELIFAWDGDAYWKARKIAQQFTCSLEKVRIVLFNKEEDPDSYGKEFSSESLCNKINKAELL